MSSRLGHGQFHLRPDFTVEEVEDPFRDRGWRTEDRTDQGTKEFEKGW